MAQFKMWNPEIARGYFYSMCMQISMCLRGFFISFLPFIEGDGLPKLPYYHTHLLVSDATTILLLLTMMVISNIEGIKGIMG